MGTVPRTNPRSPLAVDSRFRGNDGCVTPSLRPHSEGKNEQKVLVHTSKTLSEPAEALLKSEGASPSVLTSRRSEAGVLTSGGEAEACYPGLSPISMRWALAVAPPLTVICSSPLSEKASTSPCLTPAGNVMLRLKAP